MCSELTLVVLPEAALLPLTSQWHLVLHRSENEVEVLYRFQLLDAQLQHPVQLEHQVRADEKHQEQGLVLL